ncbi:hypothetical protein A2U01_0115920, partial [Trifolium medium]|nr:hypothetical protein [Trifolium medium]
MLLAGGHHVVQQHALQLMIQRHPLKSSEEVVAKRE